MATKKTRPEASAPLAGNQAAPIPSVEPAPAHIPAPRAARKKSPPRATPAASSRPRGRSARAIGADTSAKGAPIRAGARATGATDGRAGRNARPAAPARGKGKAVRAAEVTDHDIRMRAYFLFLEYGPAGGSELDYWMRAERELRGSSRGE